MALRDLRALSHPDDIHLRAAVGWIELGNYLEANEARQVVLSRLDNETGTGEFRHTYEILPDNEFD